MTYVKAIILWVYGGLFISVLRKLLNNIKIYTSNVLNLADSYDQGFIIILLCWHLQLISP